MKGLPLQLVKYLQGTDWTPKGELTAIRWVHRTGKSRGHAYLPETVGRALRSLEEDRFIAVKPCGISVQYKYLPHHRRADYIPSSARVKGKESTLFKETGIVSTIQEMAYSFPYNNN